MRRILSFLAVALVCAASTACATPQARSRAVIVRSDGSQSSAVISASDAVVNPGGPQEIAGIALPFPPFLVKASLTWDGTPLFWAPSASAPQYANYAATYGGCAQAAPQCGQQYTTQTVTVMEPYWETETRQVQKQRPVQRTVQIPAVQVVIPQELPNPCQPTQSVPYCAPAPQAAPQSTPCPPTGQKAPGTPPPPTPAVAALETPTTLDDCHDGKCFPPSLMASANH